MKEIISYLENVLRELESNKDRLNALDAAIGDGDHGTNVVRGFQAVLSQKHLFTNESSIDKDLMVCATQLMSKIGGSSGPLLGSAFMALSMALKGKTTFTNQDIAQALQMSIERIQALGKSRGGEKTMLDALIPAAQALQHASALLDLNIAYDAATKGANDTISMLATKGRASYLGERSIGHMDPGACSISLIFKGLAGK
ncbi:MAG: dihydroxyacetone kinase subunit L [Mycoplasmataceae bacterium]|jgi:dihydroxyacetone kinase-like protein|nr:dihydroxyacetone kinase subunit L [Mycoplasmataceae bacterium]